MVVPLVSLSSVTAGYQGIPVLKDVDMTVSAGEIVAVFGRNGAGKTTLLKTIVDLVEPISGEVLLDGDEGRSGGLERAIGLGVGYVPETREIFADLTVRENLLVAGVPFYRGRALKEAVSEALDRFPVLAERRAQRAGLLSGGEQQMLALSRALLSKPRILLLDEPLEGLHVRICDQLITLLAEAREASGLSLIWVDRRIDLMLPIVDRYVVIEGGRLVLQGDRQDLQRDRTSVEEAMTV